MATEHPTWVKQRVFAIPATLVKRLPGLSAEDQLNFSRVASEVVIKTKKNPVLYKPIPSKRFKDTVGTNYKKFVDQLAEWQIIQVNPRYRSTGERTFCMSYRLTHRAAAAEKRKIWFEKKVVQPLKDRSKLTDDVAAFVHRNLQRLAIRADLLPQADVIDEVAAEQWAETIYRQQFNLKYSGNVKRMFHSVIVMPRVARRNLILKDTPTTPLYEYDIKSCHPVLMLALVKKSGEDAKAFTDLLDGDIYSTVARECGVEADRDDMKVDFLKFANGKAKNYFHAYFSERFPKLVQFMDKNKKKMAWFCQAVEAKIMTQIVPRLLMCSGNQGATSTLNLTQESLICGGDSECFYIPMHDGWLGVERDEAKIAAAVREDFSNRVGFRVTITKTPVAGGEKATLPEWRPTVAVKRITRHR